MQLAPTLALSATVFLALLGTPQASPDPGSKKTDRVVRAAGYDFRYFGKDLGEESFTITRTPTGYRIEATLDLHIDGQVPSHGVYELDENRRLLRATYRELIRNGAEAEYRIEDGVLIARGVGGSATGERRMPLEDGAIVTGPHYVTDFFVLDPLKLDVGRKHEQIAYAFGFGSWTPSRMTLESEREADRRVTDTNGNRVGTTVYRCVIVTPEKTFRTRSYLDKDGVSLTIKVNAPIGTMNVTLQ